MDVESSAGRREEQVAVRTTIVGGRPPGSGRGHGAIPRGIEVLIKKAAVDDDFRKALLERRAGAAQLIQLELGESEVMMINSAPIEQLESIIRHVQVPDHERRAFLGKVATAMLAVLGASVLGCDRSPPATKGIRPDKAPVTEGIRPDLPDGADIPAGSKGTPQPPSPPAPPEASRGIRPDRPKS